MSLPRLASAVLATLVLLAFVASSATAEIVRLKDGSLLHGTITEFDESTGLTLQRVDTGGIVRLRWEHLPAIEIKRIKSARGFTGEDAAPWMVEVVHLVMRNGTTESGILEEDGDDSRYTLRRRGSRDTFPRGQVRSVETGQVEGLEVYTPEELYLLIVEARGAPTDAVRHLALAIACEGAKLYDAAGDHYRTVAELDPRMKSELVASRLSQLDIKLEDAVETAAIDEIRTALYRRRFEEARELAGAFRETYATSRQMGDLIALEGEIARRKKEYFGKRIAADYFDELEQRIDRLARDKTLQLDDVRELCEGSVHPELISDLSQAYVMTSPLVQDLWDARRGGSVRTSSYTDGTFILGKDKALDFGRFEVVEDEAGAGAADEQIEEGFDDLVEKVKAKREALAQQRKTASRGAALEDFGLTPDEWWAVADTDVRRRWIMAYYAEFSGSLRVIEAKARNCRRCEGGGIVDGTNEKGEPVEEVCPICKGLKKERVIRAR